MQVRVIVSLDCRAQYDKYAINTLNKNTLSKIELKQADCVAFILRLYLFVMKLHARMRTSYERLIATNDTNNPRNQRCGGIDVINITRSNRDNQGQALVVSANKEDQSQHSEDEDWDWRGFPDQFLGARMYDRISTCRIVYPFVVTLFNNQLSQLCELISRPLFDMPGNCLLLGRFVFHPAITQTSGLIFPGFHLIWRSINAFASKPLNLSLVNFL